MAASEIEKLERRYAENPHGLTFAPLAEVHRKNGEVSRALELLRVGLELHPNYIPASIVLGRCQQDLGDLPAAEEAFAHVLRLDDENVIALKSLADINERQDRLDDAERWLRRLVAVDRSNEEARQQLQHIEAARQAVSSGAPAAPAREEAPAPQPPAQPVSTANLPSEPPEIAPLDLADDLKPKAAELPAPEPAVLEDKKAAAPAEIPPPIPTRDPERPAVVEDSGPLPGLESAQFEPPPIPPAGPLGLEIETESDVVLRSSGASEFSVPDASQDFAALAAKLNASRPRNPGRRASDRVTADARGAAPKPEPVPPAEPLEPPVPPPQSPAPAYSARVTKGQSIAAFFQTLLLSRPPADASAAEFAGGTRPNQDLDASNAEVPSAASPPAGQEHDGLVSFDDFFGSAAGESSLASGSGEPGKDDLDQFHNWLQNLKR